MDSPHPNETVIPRCAAMLLTCQPIQRAAGDLLFFLQHSKLRTADPPRKKRSRDDSLEWSGCYWLLTLLKMLSKFDATPCTSYDEEFLSSSLP